MSLDSRPDHTSRTIVGAVAAALSLLQMAAYGPAKTAQSSRPACSVVVEYPRKDIVTSSGIQHLSSRAVAYFAFGYDSTASRKRRSQGYVIVARGESGWYRAGALTRAGGKAHGSEQRIHVWEAGGRQLTALFDPTAKVVELLGTRVGLDTANVILLDRIDGVGGPPIIRGTACAKRLRVNHSAKDLLNGLPVLRDFVSPDGAA